MPIVPIFLLGSRGDVLPVLSVVQKLVGDEQFSLRFVIVTHACYERTIVEQFGDTVTVIAIRNKPIVTSGSIGAFYNDDYIDAFEKSAIRLDDVPLVIGNLFALSVWNYSLRLGVQCIMIHPTIPTAVSLIRDDLLASFSTLQPKIYAKVNHSEDSSARQLSYADYGHWLWPTLAEHIDENILPTNLRGPVVLILCSPKLVVPTWPETARYHVCGFVQAGDLGEKLCLNPALETYDASPTAARPDVGIPVLVDTAAVLKHLAIASEEENDAFHTLCVDFGSMTLVLADDDRLAKLVRAIIHVPLPLRYVFVCHGFLPAISEAIVRSVDAQQRCRFALVPQSIDHSRVLPRCVAVIHHGGSGTMGACMAAGVPQMVVPVMYDQAENGSVVEELRLGKCIALKALVPELESDLPDASGVPAGAVKLLEEAVAHCISPPQRLRCACVGRDMRADPAEDGLSNAVRILTCCLLEALHSESAQDTTAEDMFGPGLVATDDGRVRLPNGLEVYAHAEAAPEETLFLYQEIFERQVYGAAVDRLRPGDLVVDIGSNIGLFALYVHLRTQSNGMTVVPPPVRVLTVEPIPENVALLRRNMKQHGIDCAVYSCALGRAVGAGRGASTFGASEGEPGESRAFTPDGSQKKFRYYPHIPGNSCSAERVAANLQAQQEHMNAAVLARACAAAEERWCPVTSLSCVLDHFFSTVAPALPPESGRKRALDGASRDSSFAISDAQGSGGDALVPWKSERRIALLKIDVEGDELEVLQGILPEHWQLVESVVAEVAVSLVAPVTQLLHGQGFEVSRLDDSEDGSCTGNCIVHAWRTSIGFG